MISLESYIEILFQSNATNFDEIMEGKYKLFRSTLMKFFNSNKPSNALSVYYSFFDLFENEVENQDIIFDLLDMYKSEELLGKIIDSQRDHFVHSINVFCLGLALFQKNTKIKEAFVETICDDERYFDSCFSDFLLRWGLASFLHDVGYDVEMLFKSNTNGGLRTEVEDFDEYMFINKLGVSGLDLISSNLQKRFELDEKHVTDKFSRIPEDITKQRCDHGIISAIRLLERTANPTKDKVLFDLIVDSATSIFLHNFSKYGGLKHGKISVESHPIAFLLILCDELQEWGRKNHSESLINGVYPVQSSLYIQNNKLRLKFLFDEEKIDLRVEDLEDEKKEKIKKYLDMDCFKEFGLKANPLQKDNDVENANLMSDIMKIAEEIHEHYIEKVKSDGRNAEYDCDWSDLPSNIKLQNISQASSYIDKLDHIGCFFQRNKANADIKARVSEEEILDLAILEHKRWMDVKIQNGWSFDPVRDDANLKHDNLVDWYKLDSKVQSYDIEPVKNMFKILRKLGYTIYSRL